MEKRGLDQEFLTPVIMLQHFVGVPLYKGMP